jgi:hypothetical protein
VKVFAAVIFLALSWYSSAQAPSGATTAEINGEVFIVTGEHQSIKLGLVTIAAFDPGEIRDLMDSTRAEIAAETTRLNRIVPRIVRVSDDGSRLEKEVTTSDLSRTNFQAWSRVLDSTIALASKASVLKLRSEWMKNYLESPAPFFKRLPKAVAATTTDADGKFKLILPAAGRVVIGATADRRVVDKTEYYFWLVNIEANGSASLTLSDDNQADTASNESLLHTLTLTAPGGGTETIEKLTSDLDELEKRIAAALPPSGRR